jgi:hypothetical protein
MSKLNTASILKLYLECIEATRRVVYETMMNWTSTVPRKEETVTIFQADNRKGKGHLDNLNKDGEYS